MQIEYFSSNNIADFNALQVKLLSDALFEKIMRLAQNISNAKSQKIADRLEMIFVELDDTSNFNRTVQELEKLGYDYTPERGISLHQRGATLLKN